VTDSANSLWGTKRLREYNQFTTNVVARFAWPLQWNVSV
jgi:hypothetical protein